MPREITWEENTEKRVGILENKMDKLLDPEVGIYPKLGSIDEKLSRLFIAFLIAAMGAIVAASVAIALAH